MNRLCYRIVFNRARAMLMAVAETVSAGGKGARTRDGIRVALPDIAWIGIPAIKLAVWACMGLPMLAGAQIVADPNAGGNRPTVISTPNGLPQVNITRPSGAGVSTNHYSQFDVNKAGAILNNSPVVTNTQQAGYINGNPNLLPGGSARIIVNQVNSMLPSQLRGYLEVAGPRAEVIVANPNGILVDGAGFINTSRATLTTGLPVYGGSGSLDAFHVTGGQIQIEGAGLNAANVDQVDLIARAVKVNAAVYGNRLNVVAGANQVDYNTLEASAIAGSGMGPTTGIDVSQLGGMYANKILLASTEQGVGVSLRGVMAAQAGDMTLTSAGKLVMSGSTSATGNITATARDGVDNSGRTYAGNRLDVATQGALTNDGTLAAGAGLSAAAASIASTGTLAAGVGADGTVGQAGNLDLSATGALQASKVLAGGNASLRGTSVDLAQGQASANGALNVVATDGKANLRGATAYAGGALGIEAKGAIDATQATISAGTNAALRASSVSTAGGQLTANGAIDLQSAGAIDNAGGIIQAGGKLDIDAASLNNAAGRVVSLNGDGLRIKASGDIANTGGIARAGAQGGVIGGNGDVRIDAATLTNSGTLSAGGNATLQLAALKNDDGSLMTGGNATIHADQGVSNRNGQIGAANLDIDAAQIDNAGGQIEAEGVTLQASGDLSNAGGTITQFGTPDASITAGGKLDNTGGVLTANGTNAIVSGQTVQNNGGHIAHAGTGTLTLQSAGTLDNTAGTLAGNGDIGLSAQDLINTGGAKLAATGNLDLAARNSVNNRGGTIYGGKDLKLEQGAARIDNQGGTLLGGTDLSLKVASLNNLGGAIRANRDAGVSGAVAGSGEMIAGRNLTLAVIGDYVNDAANKLGADGNLTLTASGTLTNTGKLAAGNTLTAQGANIVNAAGAVLNGNTTNLNAAGTITNAGRIEGDTVNTTSAAFDNTATVIGNDVQVNAQRINNTGAGAIMAATQNLKLYASDAVTNVDGATLYSMGNLQIARDGTRAADGMLANQTGSLINSSATIEADGDIDIAARQVVNKRTSIETEAGSPVETARTTLTTWLAGFEDFGMSSYSSILFPQWRWSGGDSKFNAEMLYVLPTPITVEVPKTDVKYVDPATKTLSLTKSLVDQYMSGEVRCDMNGEDCTYPIINREIAKNAVQYYEGIEDTGTSYKITFWPDFDPTRQIRPDQVRVRYDLGEDQHAYSERSRTTVTTTATDRLISATPAAVMQARGAIRINADGGSILNQSSTMAAGGALVRRATGGTIEDVGTALQQTVTTAETSTFYWHERSGGNSDTKQVVYPTTPQPTTTVQALPAIATGGGSVQTTARDVTVSAIDAVGNPVAINGPQTTSASGQNSRPQTLGTAGGGIPNLRLPTNGLYTFRTTPGDTYLVATDPRFTDYGKFISSDYMLGALGLDPQKTQKRLGDGFYEEKLVRDQITQLTGKTFLTGYTDQLEEYKALMDNGVTYGRAFNLTPGVGLTDEQMRQLTTDMVWMVSQDVTLPDGTTQSVLVPKVYLAQGSGVDLNSTGALVAGNAVEINATGTVRNSGSIVGDVATQVLGTDIVNRGNIGGTKGTTLVSATQDVRNEGGRIGGQDVVVAAGRDVINDARTVTRTAAVGDSTASATGVEAVGTIAGAGSVSVLAGRDINMAGGAVDAGQNALLAAGRDVNLGTQTLGMTQDYEANGGNSYSHDKTTTNLGTSINAGGSVVAVAGRDATLTASAVNGGDSVSVIAGRDTTVTAALDTHSHSEGSLGGKNAEYKQSSYDETASGSIVQAGKNVTLAAGQSDTANAVLASVGIAPTADATAATASGKGNLSILASGVSSGDGGTAQLVATGDVTIGAVNETHTSDSWSQTHKSGFLSKTETTTTSSTRDSVAVGSVVSADAIVGSAGRDMTISGSTVAATHDVSLEAGRNLTITTAESTSESQSYSHTKSTGFGATGGGISYGMRDQKDTVNESSVTQTGSLVGSTDGNVNLKAGSTLRVTGSQVIAAKDLTGIGADVIIEAAKGSQHHDETHEIKQTGFTLAVSGGAIGSAINAGQKVSSATKSQDGRASALWGIAAARDTYDAAMGAGDAMKSLGEGKGPAGTAVTLSFGTSKSKSTLTQDSTTHTGSNLQAGGTATFIATGVDADGNKTAGNLDIIGSDLSATKVGLGARGDVNIVSATDTYENHSTSKSSSGSIGVSLGSKGYGVSVSGSTSKGNGDTSGTTQVNSHVTGSESVSIVSGNDTNILGGVVSGGKVMADVGGNLNLASRQDTEESHARQQSVGGGLSWSQGGGVTGSFTATKGKGDGSYANVTEQSGIRAGDGGFDINVKGNTDLKGAVIASTATEDKNKLTTGTLSWSDIENKSDYSATSMGLSGGFTFGTKVEDKSSGPTAGKNTGGVSPMIPQHESGSQRGVAQSGIAGGTITITDQDKQTQDVATLNRDTSNTNTGVGKGPDLNNVLNKQADMMAAAQAAGEAVARTVGDIAGSKLNEANAALKKANDAFEKDPSEANGAAVSDAKAAVEGWREGGEYRAALHAAGGAMIAGLGGGSAIAGAAGAGAASKLAPTIQAGAEHIYANLNTGNSDLDYAVANSLGNLAAGALGAALGGGAGAATASNVDRFNRQFTYATPQDLRTVAAKEAAKSGMTAEQMEKAMSVVLGTNYDDTHTARADGVTYEQYMKAQAALLSQPANSPLAKEYAEAMRSVLPQFAYGDTDSAPNLARIPGFELAKSVDPLVVAQGTTGGKSFTDTNQGARANADPSQPTLISDRVIARTESVGRPTPNGTMATAHAEIGVIEQGAAAGRTQGQKMTMSVSGNEPVCGYCRGDIAAAAQKAGLSSLTINEQKTGAVLYWEPGMKSLKELK